MKITKTALIVILLMLIFLFIVLVIENAEAEKIPHDWRKVDDGETPVVIYLEGSTWNIEKSIYTSSLYYGLNMICICSRTKQYNFSGYWRQEDLDRMAGEVLDLVRGTFPEVKTVINISFSNGGYMANALHRQCRENGIETLCAVCLESWPERWGFPDIEADSVPLMIGLSQTKIPRHITEKTMEYAQTAKATVREYPVNHGALETDHTVHSDVYDFIKGVMQ